METTNEREIEHDRGIVAYSLSILKSKHADYYGLNDDEFKVLYTKEKSCECDCIL